VWSLIIKASIVGYNTCMYHSIIASTCNDQHQSAVVLYIVCSWELVDCIVLMVFNGMSKCYVVVMVVGVYGFSLGGW